MGTPTAETCLLKADIGKRAPMYETRRRFIKRSAALAAGISVLTVSETPRTQAATPAPLRAPLRVNHDLHTHTLFSDGAACIPLHVFEARAFELDAMALTDHFTPGSKIHGSEAEFDRYLSEIQRERTAQAIDGLTPEIELQYAYDAASRLTGLAHSLRGTSTANDAGPFRTLRQRPGSFSPCHSNPCRQDRRRPGAVVDEVLMPCGSVTLTI
jgi:hypothetical protein